MNKTEIIKTINRESGVSQSLLRAWWPIVSDVGTRAGYSTEHLIELTVAIGKRWQNHALAMQGLCHFLNNQGTSELGRLAMRELARYGYHNYKAGQTGTTGGGVA